MYVVMQVAMVHAVTGDDDVEAAVEERKLEVSALTVGLDC
jgi:hypothetical protein